MSILIWKVQKKLLKPKVKRLFSSLFGRSDSIAYVQTFFYLNTRLGIEADLQPDLESTTTSQGKSET